ncbi:MAG: chain-length determining protein, partial [Muribaculaceae bacterium]|nr:chain-length determining protein [Muribaculaceae bacterium]
AMTLWKQRRKIFKWCGIGAVVGLVIAFSIPKEYTATVSLAPELNTNRTSSGLGALASMAGINLGSTQSVDAVYPMLYPDVVSSIPFMTGLFDVKVHTQDEDSLITVENYILEDQRQPWWNYVLSAPFRLIGMLLPADDEEDEDHKLDNFHLTRDEYNLVQFLQGSINTSFDMKTMVVSIDVTTQDPMVSAILADTVVSRLQQYITNYRTDKARKDLEYALKINEEAKQDYYEAQQKYADFQDRNQGLAFQVAQTQRERLSNEVSLAFSLYNQTSQQVQMARAKVQETNPVYAVITPASVPIYASRPRKAMILIGFVFLAFVASSAWILFGKPLLASLKEKSKNQQEQEAPQDADKSDE